MKNKTISFEEALIDTIKFYSHDISKRSCASGDRFYTHDDGRKCAIGRFVRDKHASFFHRFDDHNICGSIEAVVHAYQTNQMLCGRTISEKEAISELTIINDAELIDMNFLQILHDEDINWNRDGLTPFGFETINSFRPDLLNVAKQALEEELMMS